MRSAVVTVVLVMALVSLRLGLGWRAAVFGNARNEEGRPEGRPDASAKIVISATPLPLARNVERGVQDSDVLPLDLQGRRFWVVGPANDEVGLVDAGDYAEPPTVRLAIAFPIFPDHVRTDLKRIPGVGRADRLGFTGR